MFDIQNNAPCEATLPECPPCPECPECPECGVFTGALNQAIYDSSRDVIFAVRCGYTYKLNATTGVLIDVERYCYPDFDDAYLCLDPVTNHIFATSWMTFADQNENVTASRFVKKLVKINPDTLAAVSTINLPTATFTDLDIFESGPRQIIALNSLIYGLYFNAAAGNNGFLWTFNPVGLTWNSTGSFNTNGGYAKGLVYDPDLNVFWVTNATGATSYDLALNPGATLNFAASRIARAVAYRSTGAKLYFTMTKQGATTPQHIISKTTSGGADVVIDTGRPNALPFNIRYRASNDRVYVPTWGDDTVVIINPSTDTVESVKTGFDSPFDVVFTPTKAWAVQHGRQGLREIT